MVRVGDTVVIMSAPGVFEVIAIDGDEVTVQGKNGVVKTVRVQAVRNLEPQASA
jgi:UDP-3-O-[3-hydroxymyristoyl] glucosamine N-acyltransferase